MIVKASGEMAAIIRVTLAESREILLAGRAVEMSQASLKADAPALRRRANSDDEAWRPTHNRFASAPISSRRWK